VDVIIATNRAFAEIVAGTGVDFVPMTDAVGMGRGAEPTPASGERAW